MEQKNLKKLFYKLWVVVVVVVVVVGITLIEINLMVENLK